MSLQDRKAAVPVKVYIRQRPLTKTETERRCASLVQITSPREVTVKKGLTEKKYTFDHVFGPETAQIEVYNMVVAPLLDSILGGFNCTVFAYGQTGTGKTHTIFGEAKQGGVEFNFQTEAAVGLIPRSAHQIFSELSKLNPNTEYTVRVSFIEIYNEEVRDLLNKNALLRVYDDPMNKGSVFMNDLRKVTVLKTQDVFNWLNLGLIERRKTAADLNLQISRAHTLFSFSIDIREGSPKGEQIIRTGRLHLVDLAGIENADQSEALNAAGTINRSLVTVGKIIKALAQNTQLVPYGDSKLTRILQASLGGNSKTAMIATISPNANSWEETNATLDLARAAKSITNVVHINLSRKQACLMNHLRHETTKLKSELSTIRGIAGFCVSTENYRHMSPEDEEKSRRIFQLVTRIGELEDYTRAQEPQRRNLAESFQRTKDYVTERRQVLAANDEALRRGENRVQRQNLTENTSTDLNICQIPQNEEATARATPEMAASTSHGTRPTAQDTSQNANNAEQKRHFVEFLQQEHLRDFYEINTMSDLIRARSLHYQIQMEEVFRNPSNDFCIGEVQNLITQMYNQNLTHLHNHLVITQGLTNLKEAVNAKVAELTATTEQVFVPVQDRTQRGEVHNSAQNIMINLRHVLVERQRQLQGQLNQDRAMAQITRNQLARVEREEHLKNAEAVNLQQSLKLVDNLIEQNNRQRMQLTRDIVRNYFRTANQAAQPQRPVNGRIDIKSSVEARDRVRQYPGGLVAPGQENQNGAENQSPRDVPDWNTLAASFQMGMEQTKRVAASARQTLDHVRRAFGRPLDNIPRAANRTILTPRIFRSRVRPMGNVGATPVRRTNNVPRRIIGRFRREEPSTSGANDDKGKDEPNKEN